MSSWTSDLRSRSRPDRNWSSCISFDPHWRDKHDKRRTESLSLFTQKLLQKTRWWPMVTSDDLGTPSKGHRWHFSVEWPPGTCNSMILSILRGSGGIQRKLKCIPLAYNGEVVRLTWPQVTDIHKKKSEIYVLWILSPFLTPRSFISIAQQL